VIKGKEVLCGDRSSTQSHAHEPTIIAIVHWDDLKALFDQARALPPERRAAFLDHVCRDDAALREQLTSMLAAHGQASDYFENFAAAVLPAPLKHRMNRQPENREAPAPDPLIGQRISHYEIQERLGSGGMGVVYKARHSTLNRFAALKFLPPRLSANEDAKARFVHEAQVAYALDHPNICTIYDIDETDSGRLYIAMAYYEGETLKRKIRRGPLPVVEALDYATQMSEGLAKAHGAGIVHQDIKPANVMVTPEGVVKLLDFGVAKVMDVSPEPSGTTMGTVAYMSPEQAQGEAVDPRTDIWSLGVVLYELLTGQPPFKGGSAQEMLLALLNTEPVPATRFVPGLPPEVGSIINKCLARPKEDRYQTTASLFADLYRITRQARSGALVGVSDSLAEFTATPSSRTNPLEHARIFISYKHGVEPDDRVAEAIRATLGQRHKVFIDKMRLVGTRWIEQIETELARSDFLIVLLSARSVHSEMVLGEIEMARRLAHERGGRPMILPVRLAYQEPFAYPLSVYLNTLNGMHWEDEVDTPRLIEELTKAMAGGGLTTPAQAPSSGRRASEAFPAPLMAAQPPRLEMPEGTMDPQSAFYVERPEDDVALSAIGRQGVTVTIKGPRQMGKSSLLMRMMAAASAAGKGVAFVDFHLFEHAALLGAEPFFRQFCTRITDALNLEDQVDVYWKRPLANPHRCTRYVARHVLKSLDRPLLLAMDEVERVFDTDFGVDFFSMLRSWHNDRAVEPCWKQLDLVLVTSTEPYHLIETPNLSPFNVGEVIALEGFSLEQVTDLNQRHGAPLSDEQLKQFMLLLGGHPYLMRKALFLAASGRVSADTLLKTATDEHGPFGDHLRYHFFRLHGQDDLIDGLRQVLRDQTCEAEEVFWRLRGAGLVRRVGRKTLPWCTLYADYFRRRLDD